MGVVQSIATALQPREDRKVALATLAELDPNTDRVAPDTIKSFQYYPETIQMGRSVEYAEKRMLGGSHPLYQWMTSNGRSLSFDAVFSRDIEPPDATPSPQNAPGGIAGALNAASGVAAQVSNLAKNPISAAISLVKGSNGNDDSRYNVDVQAAVAWLMSKTYPTYGPNTNLANPRNGLATAPPKLILYLPNSGLVSGVGSTQTGKGITPISDSIYCILRECNVTYEAFFRNGAPRIVTISLSFEEIIQVGNSWGFIGRDKVLLDWERRYTVKDPNAKVLGGNNNGKANASALNQIVNGAIGKFNK